MRIHGETFRHEWSRVLKGVDWAADQILGLLATAQGDPNVKPVLEWIGAPGTVVLHRLPLADSPLAQLGALVLGWYFWVRATRGLYFLVARPMGVAAPEHYLLWAHLWLPWQKPYRALLEIRRFFRQRRFHEGPAQYWAGFFELACHPFNPRRGCIPVGRLPFMQRIGLHLTVGLPDGGKHVACISYAAGGKTSWVMTWLGCLPASASAMVFDVDGAMFNAFAPALRKVGHPVIGLDVDGIARGVNPLYRWNPLHELTLAARRHGAAAVVAFAQTLATALIVEDSRTQPVFALTARVIVTALILYVWLVEEDKSLMRVRALLTRGLPERIELKGESGFGRLVFEMSALPAKQKDGLVDDGCGGAICAAIANASGLLADSKPGHDSSASPDSFRKTAIYQTAWLDDPNVIKVMGGPSDICCDDLKLSNAVVFIIATLNDIQTRLGALVRAFTLLSLYAFQKTEPDKKLRYPMLMILDEFPNLGRMETVALAAPGFRRYGVRLVTISQSIGLLRKTYPAECREFLNQAECVLWMGVSQTDTETLTFFSRDVLGECVRKEKVDGYHWSIRLVARLFGVKALPPARYQNVARQLLTPQQAAAFLDRATGQVVVTREGRAPMRLKRLLYWKELPVWRYVVHRGHGETFLRSCTRRLVTSVTGGWR